MGYDVSSVNNVDVSLPPVYDEFMSNLLHRIFPFMATTVEVKALRAQATALVPEGLEEAKHFIIQDSINLSAKRRDVDALRVYLRFSPAEHTMVEFAIDALRKSLGVREVANIITVEHIEAFSTIQDAYYEACLATETHVKDTPRGTVIRMVAIAMRDMERVTEIAAVITERCIMDYRVLEEVLADMDSVHGSLSGGML